MVEEEAQQNDLTRFERFKQWAKTNLGGISVVAISVAGIITTIVMGARTVIKKGARATSKFARTLAKVGEKVAPIIGGLLNLAAKLLTLSHKGDIYREFTQGYKVCQNVSRLPVWPPC